MHQQWRYQINTRNVIHNLLSSWVCWVLRPFEMKTVNKNIRGLGSKSNRMVVQKEKEKKRTGSWRSNAVLTQKDRRTQINNLEKYHWKKKRKQFREVNKVRILDTLWVHLMEFLLTHCRFIVFQMRIYQIP